jgi:N-acetylmuramic acid 6-phosphate etherase
MEIKNLTTEERNPNSLRIDSLTTLEMVRLINNEDKKVALAIEKELPKIAEAIDRMAERYQNGGRLIYCGAGTSGRLGALDAAELTPTYGVDPKRAFGIMAGGREAMFSAVEDAEDSKELAVKDLKERGLCANDVLICVAASGRTPYAVSALEYGAEAGALTVSVTCNNESEMNRVAQIGIAPVVGPEAITGSTRMKAGSAQKMVLNMLSTGVMVKSGKVYQNLMVHVQPTNQKLIRRSVSIIQEATGAPVETAEEYLNKAGNNVAVAIVMLKTGKTLEESAEALGKNQDRVTDAVKFLSK